MLDCFPSYSNTWKTVTEQLDFIKGLDQSPDIVINLKVHCMYMYKVECVHISIHVHGALVQKCIWNQFLSVHVHDVIELRKNGILLSKVTLILQCAT